MGLSLEFRVRSVSPLPLGGFYLNFGQMFTYGTMCRTHYSAMGLKDKVTSLSPEFRLHSISPLLLEGFSFNYGQILPQ